MKGKEKLRKLLIKHLDNCLVPYENWRNRDTPISQERCATMRMYLRAGCDFKVVYGYDDKEIPAEELNSHFQKTNTMYLSIFHYQFEDEGTWDTHYFPSPKTISDCNGKDRY